MSRGGVVPTLNATEAKTASPRSGATRLQKQFCDQAERRVELDFLHEQAEAIEAISKGESPSS
jgi:predicted esterase YcpF (UPF0227 family)